MLHPKILEVTTDKATGNTYVLVHFWQTKAARTRDDRPYLIEDFLMSLTDTGTRLIDLDNPHLGSETFTRDVRAELRQNIRSYVAEAEKFDYHGDNSSATALGGEFFAKGRLVRPANSPITAIERDDSDPNGALTADVKALRNRNIDL